MYYGIMLKLRLVWPSRYRNHPTRAKLEVTEKCLQLMFKISPHFKVNFYNHLMNKI